MITRVAADLLGGGIGGKPGVLAMDRTYWDFGKTTINSLMISVIWTGAGVPSLWILLPSERIEGGGNSESGMHLLLRPLWSGTQTSGVRD